VLSQLIPRDVTKIDVELQNIKSQNMLWWDSLLTHNGLPRKENSIVHLIFIFYLVFAKKLTWYIKE